MSVKNFVEQVGSKNLLPRKNESRNDCISRLTHLFFDRKDLTFIGDMSTCENLTVLYLQYNQLTKIENLETLNKLKELYLQHNNISRIENLDQLRCLEKLFIGYNKISVVEGLENNHRLTELHVEGQYLNKGEELCFDPRTFETLSGCLLVLNVSKNNMRFLDSFKNIYCLRTLRASHNRFKYVEDFIDSLRGWPFLIEAWFHDCPAAKKRMYRETIITHSNKLVLLDGKPIQNATRIHLQNFMKSKQLHKINSQKALEQRFKKQEENKIVGITDLQNALPTFPTSSSTHSADSFIPWKAMTREGKTFHRVPQPFLKMNSGALKGSFRRLGKSPHRQTDEAPTSLFVPFQLFQK